MAHYLVTALPREELLQELGGKLARDEFITLRPFGKALSFALRRSRSVCSGFDPLLHLWTKRRFISVRSIAAQ